MSEEPSRRALAKELDRGKRTTQSDTVVVQEEEGETSEAMLQQLSPSADAHAPGTADLSLQRPSVTPWTAEEETEELRFGGELPICDE